MKRLPHAALLVRTWFGDDAAWTSPLRAVRTPSEDGFLANVVPVDEPAWEGLSAEALRAEQSTGPFVSSALWSVENNINLANMDWPEFASSVGEDGVFRGF